MSRFASFAAILAILAMPHGALAASSPWQDTEGGGVRLVVESTPADGRLRGAIEIDLKPGWKTYWRDPGDAGIPPTIEASGPGVAGVDILYPVPKRFDDGVSVWAGYDEPVSLPVVFTLAEGASPGLTEAHVFLGVCEDICIPVDARFTVDLAAGAPGDDAAVEAAFAALPAPASEGEGISAASIDGKTVTVETENGGGELFVAAPPGWSFSPPRPAVDGAAFAFDILFQPKSAEISGQEIAYTLVSGGKAVTGSFALP